MANPPWFKQHVSAWLCDQEIMLMDPLAEYALLRLRMEMWRTPNCMLPDNDTILMRLSRLDFYRGLEGDLCSEKELSKCLASAKQMLSKCLADGKPMLYDRGLLDQWKHLSEISNMRSASGRLGGSSKKSGTKASKAKVKQTISISRSLSRSGSDPNPTTEKLTQYGTHIRMLPSEHAELCRVFGPELVAQEFPTLDIWIEKTNSKYGPKYRRPEHNHYLLARTTWLPGKTLNNKTGVSGGFKTAGERRHANSLLAVEQVFNDERKNEPNRNSNDASHVPGVLADLRTAPAKR